MDSSSEGPSADQVRAPVGDEQDDEDSYVMYKDRSEWSDLEPVQQDDGPDAVVLIEYSSKFQDVYDFFRGVLKKQEKTPRVLGLTADAILLNAANYTVWQYRRDVLMALEMPCLMTKDGLNEEFAKEFEFSRQMIEENQKNYQVWHHRKSLVSWASGFKEDVGKISLECEKSCNKLVEQELDLTEKILSKDSKNYHAWQHRQWILLTFGSFSNELPYIDSLIRIDVRNNSAWNQRYFVFKNLSHTESELDTEIEYAWKHILMALSNESPWNYLQGLLRLYNEYGWYESTVKAERRVIQKALELMNSKLRSNPMLSFMLDILEDIFFRDGGSKELYAEVLKICDLLISEDPLRKQFWEHTKESWIMKHWGTYEQDHILEG